MRVLLVTNDPIFFESVSNYLTEHDYEVLVCVPHDGKDPSFTLWKERKIYPERYILRLVTEWQPHIILFDMVAYQSDSELDYLYVIGNYLSFSHCSANDHDQCLIDHIPILWFLDAEELERRGVVHINTWPDDWVDRNIPHEELHKVMENLLQRMEKLWDFIRARRCSISDS